MKLTPRAGLPVILALVISAIAAQPASALIHPDSTSVTGSSTNSQVSYGVFTISCNTETFQGKTGVSSSSLSGTMTVSNSPAGCATNVGVSCVVSPAAGVTTTLTVTTSTATGGTGTYTLGGAYTIDCGLGFCLITVPAQGPKSTVTYTNSTQNLNINSTNVSATRSGSGGALCGPVAGNATFKADFKVTPNTVKIV